MMADLLSQVRAIAKALGFVTALVVLLPFQLIWLLITAFKPTPHQSPVARLWYYLITRLLGVRVSVIGRENLASGQKIILSNHIGYIEIMMYGYLFDAFFVAKSDIADWPVFGFLSKVSSTVFISRRPLDVKSQIVHLRNHLEQKKSLIVFPEGTSNNGRQVLGFKAGFLNALIDMKEIPAIQPVSLVFTGLNGHSLLSLEHSDAVAWYGDMILAPHLWNLFKQKTIDVTVEIHPPMIVTLPVEPKKIAQDAQVIITSGFADRWAAALQEYSHSGQE